MWQELCKTRKEYLERAKLDTKGYSPRRSETLLYEIARLDGMDIKKQDFFNILNDIEISPKVTREDTHRIKDLSNAFLYLVKCAQQRKRLSLDRPRPESVRLHLVTSLFFLPRICFFGAGFLGPDENNSRQIHKLSVYRYHSVLL